MKFFNIKNLLGSLVLVLVSVPLANASTSLFDNSGYTLTGTIGVSNTSDLKWNINIGSSNIELTDINLYAASKGSNAGFSLNLLSGDKSTLLTTFSGSSKPNGWTPYQGTILLNANTTYWFQAVNTGAFGDRVVLVKTATTGGMVDSSGISNDLGIHGATSIVDPNNTVYFKLQGNVVTVPEPSTCAFLGIGAIGVLIARRRNQTA